MPKVTSILVLNYYHQRARRISKPNKTELIEKSIYIYIYIYIIYIYIYISSQLLDGNKGHQDETHHPTHRQVSAPVPRPVVNGMERLCQRHGSDQTPTLPFESKNHVSINSYSVTYEMVHCVNKRARILGHFVPIYVIAHIIGCKEVKEKKLAFSVSI